MATNIVVAYCNKCGAKMAHKLFIKHGLFKLVGIIIDNKLIWQNEPLLYFVNTVNYLPFPSLAISPA